MDIARSKKCNFVMMVEDEKNIENIKHHVLFNQKIVNEYIEKLKEKLMSL